MLQCLKYGTGYKDYVGEYYVFGYRNAMTALVLKIVCELDFYSNGRKNESFMYVCRMNICYEEKGYNDKKFCS